MRTLLPLVLSPLFLFASCDKAAKAAPGTPAVNTPAVPDAKATAAVQKVTGTVGELTKTLAGITDGASAEKMKTALEGQVKALGAEMGDLGSLKGSVEGMLKPLMEKVTGLLGNADIKKAIGPVLEQLKGLLPAK